MKLIVKNKNIKLKEMNTFYLRFKGLMLKKNIKESVIFKTNSIHTMFCLEPIDIIMTDKDFNILYIYPNFKPFKIILPKKRVNYTIELPKNTIKKLDIKEKDKLKIEK